MKKFTNHIDMQQFRVQNLAPGIDPTDAVNKSQLDAAIQGLSWKSPGARVATTANITLTGVQTIDGVSVVAGDSVLVKNQTAPAANGIYVVASGAWARRADADTAAKILNAAIFVSEGTTHGNQQWTMTTDAPITLGTTGLVWGQIGGGSGNVTAGNGINIAGNVVSVDPTVVARKYSAAIGDGVATTLTVTHNLNTRDVTVSVRDAATGEEVIADNTANGINTLQLTFGVAPAAGQYRVTVVG